jgi:hypothetical protein
MTATIKNKYSRSAKSARSTRSVKPKSVRSARSKQSAQSRKSLRRRSARKQTLSPIPESGVPMEISPEKEVDISASPVLMEIVDEYSDQIPTVDFDFKGLTVSFVIIGHGGVKNTVPIKTFELPIHMPMGRINVLGMRYSGLLNLVNKNYDESTDKYLADHKNENIPELIKYLNEAFAMFLNGNINVNGEDTKEIIEKRKVIDEFKKRVDLLKKKIPNIEYFGAKIGFGKKNAQKFYSGISQEEFKKESRHSELTVNGGPLVKIYSILKGGKEYLKPGQTLLVSGLSDNITLTEIIDAAIKKVSEEGHIITVYERGLYFEQLPININIVDLTCNHTDAYPNIGFIE